MVDLFSKIINATDFQFFFLAGIIHSDLNEFDGKSDSAAKRKMFEIGIWILRFRVLPPGLRDI